ncbi:hypothetical protein N018_00205 [Pseudomonas syringae CC1557]|uniref:Uncharacterized protein n=1 Tax=Pseudomonas syringae CC1557 TaxID=1357279 RepID=W0MNA6_PSESX|nr:hypothetical protein [Pseudomonas syringae]AHG38740.1 hypothetical protein N018_00205 [Pseudomonas syringae CC1557]
MQILKNNVKAVRAVVIFCAFITICIVGIHLSFFSLFDNAECQKYSYTKKLNGGTKKIDDKVFVINICGAGVNNSLFNGDGMERVRLTVFDDQGELLVRRYYKVFWDGQPGHEPLKISENSIIYQDDKEQKDHAITMPPTRLEWIRARLPL